MPTKPTTVASYLAALPDDRRHALETIRRVIRTNLDPAYQETIQYGMIGYSVPHSIYPPGYHCDPKQPLPFASMASQKNHMALYLFCIYTDPALVEWFTRAWQATGKKLDMGKSCVRFKKLDDVPLDLVGELIARVPAADFIKSYEASLAKPRTTRTQTATNKSSKKTSKKKTSAKKTSSKKASAKKASSKKTARTASTTSSRAKAGSAKRTPTSK